MRGSIYLATDAAPKTHVERRGFVCSAFGEADGLIATCDHSKLARPARKPTTVWSRASKQKRLASMPVVLTHMRRINVTQRSSDRPLFSSEMMQLSLGVCSQIAVARRHVATSPHRSVRRASPPLGASYLHVDGRTDCVPTASFACVKLSLIHLH